MKNSQTVPQKQLKVRKRIVIFSVLVVVIALITAWYFLSRPHNYAADTIAPLEASLFEAGAAKQCTRGDAGRGWDNRAPWQEAFYTIPKSEKEAIEVVEASARQHGYNLKQATAQERGPVMVDEKFISKWYYDTNNKSSTYADLNQGPITLTATVNAEGSGGTCEGRTLKIDKDNSVISISVRLPEYK